PGRNRRHSLPEKARLPASGRSMELPMRGPRWPFFEVSLRLFGLGNELAKGIEPGVKAQKSFQHTGEQEQADADEITLVQLHGDFQPPAKADLRPLANAAGGGTAGQPGNPFDHLLIDDRQLRHYFGI